jgi:AcrR family transcriptional regulator
MAKAQFNREEIIGKAIELFWEKGFSATSMQQVVAATGLKPGSIYYSFGNKEALFKEALETYSQKRKTQIRKILENAPSIEQGLCILLDRFVQEAAEQNFRSCFLVKTQLELASAKNDLHSVAAAKLAEIETLFYQYLIKSYDKIESRRYATSIMFHILGMRIYGYQENPAKRMQQALHDGLPWLPWS